MKTINFGEKKPLVQMKVNELIKFGNENKSSNRLILKTGTLIRHEFGRNTVERTKEKTLPKMKDGMADLFDVKQVKTVRQRTDEVILVDIEWASEFVACGESKETEEELNKKLWNPEKPKRVHGDRMFKSN